MRRDPLATDVTRYLRVLDGACTANDARSCLALGRVINESAALAPDEARARAAYARACALGNGVGCMISATALHGLDGARKVLSAACAANDGQSCAVLAGLVLALDNDRLGFRELSITAATLLEARCIAGSVDDCVLAKQWIDGLDTSPDPARVIRLLRRGCDLGDGEACSLAASDPALSAAARASLYRRGCDLGRPQPCILLANEPYDANLFAHARAVAAAQCNLGDMLACAMVAASLASESLTAEQAARFDALAQRACDRALPMVCHQLAQALDEGPEVRRDHARSVELEQRACSGGYSPACPDPAAAILK